MNQYEFSDKQNSDDSFADRVLARYATLKMQSMTAEEKDDWIVEQIILENERSDGDHVTDLMVQEFPERLKSEYGVDII